MYIPINIEKILHILKQEEFIKVLAKYSQIFLVGGIIRDGFLDKEAKDIDILVQGLSFNEIENLIKKFGKISLVGESFAIIKFKPRNWNQDIDIAIPRKDRKIGKGHKGIEVYTDKNLTVLDDLERRDFTINSIAINIINKKIIDPFKGINDIKSKILRATSYTSFSEDPLRILRAIGFASRFRFDIEPHTLGLMKQHAKLIKEISGERIKEEFDKIIKKHGSTRVAYDLMERSDIDKALFGEKFSKDGFEYFDDLDLVSFYYVLGNLGHKVPWKFYKERLKGDVPVTKALMTLEKFFSKIDESNPEEENKWNVFQMIKASPMLIDAEVLPEVASKIIDQMKAGKIPMKEGDIPVNGNDIMDKFGVKDEEVGNIKNQMYKDALMNKFDWKNKQRTLKYLETI